MKNYLLFLAAVVLSSEYAVGSTADTVDGGSESLCQR